MFSFHKIFILTMISVSITMNWKQFLKPDRRKIVLFVLLAILFIFSIMIYLSSIPPGALCTTEECKIERARQDLIDILFLLIVSPFLVLDEYLVGYIPEFSNALNLIAIILSFFYWYILSCFIVWIYDRFRKKNKK